MPYRIAWTEPSGMRLHSTLSAQTALEMYVELLGKGYARVEVRDDSGMKLAEDDMLRLMALEKKGRP
jgi:hypothetical protein